jgi:hypothetical protein
MVAELSWLNCSIRRGDVVGRTRPKRHHFAGCAPHEEGQASVWLILRHLHVMSSCSNRDQLPRRAADERPSVADVANREVAAARSRSTVIAAAGVEGANSGRDELA